MLNLSRDPNDINKPDLTRLELGQIYQIKVERVLKGDNVASTLSFVQYEGFLIKP